MLADYTINDKLWLLGATSGAAYGTNNELWSYYGGTWSLISATGAPNTRYAHATELFKNPQQYIGFVANAVFVLQDLELLTSMLTNITLTIKQDANRIF